MATNWPSADEIDALDDNLVMAITKVIAENKILTENHLISTIDLFRLNPKLDIKISKRRWPPSLSYLR
jgi:hypothetical protein